MGINSGLFIFYHLYVFFFQCLKTPHMDTLRGSLTNVDSFSAQAMNLQNNYYGQFAIKQTSNQVFKWEQAYSHIPTDEMNESEISMWK